MTISSLSILLVAAIALSTFHTGFAVISPRALSTSISIPKDHDSSVLGALQVDEEGNLYSSKSSATEKDNSISGKSMLLKSVFSSLRGGDLCVDNEGNLYTPRNEIAALATSSSNALASPEGLRGGSQNHNVGGLSVDSEGNFFAADGRSPYAKKALRSLRGGDLSVDNEGIFYTPRPRFDTENKPQDVASNSRRSTNGDPSAIVLTKNKPMKKINNTRPKKNTYDDPMAFIGYNNALMET